MTSNLSVAITPLEVIAEPVPQSKTSIAPFTLTASDGSGLAVTRVDARAVMQGPLAYTELHLDFTNTEDRMREGTFAIVLPPGAAVSRFAMETNGQWQEAEVVETAVARRAYDDALHRRQDPALLEKAAGNQFTAKVFPIPAKAEKHLIISYSQDLGGRVYRLPLIGLPTVPHVDAVVHAEGIDGAMTEQSLHRAAWQPDADFIAQVGTAPAAVAADTNFVAALVAHGSGKIQTQPVAAATILVDTSASRALGFANYVQAIHELASALGDAKVSVIAFDQDTAPIFTGAGNAYGAAEDRALLARGAAGASDLGQAIAAIAAGTPAARLIVVTDGVITAGQDQMHLVTAIEKLPIERLDVVLAGGIRDPKLAEAIAHAKLPRAGDVLDLDRGAATIAHDLAQPVLTDLVVDVPGATWVYPKRIAAAREGSPVLVYAKLAHPAPSVDVTIGEAHHHIGLGVGTAALVARAVAGAELEELEGKLAQDPSPSLRTAIAKTSIASRVLSSQTAMLVLESDADFARYHIDRTALADILVVNPDGTLDQGRRTQIAFTPAQTQSAPKERARLPGEPEPAVPMETAAADGVGIPTAAAPMAEPSPPRSRAMEPAKVAMSRHDDLKIGASSGSGGGPRPSRPVPVVTLGTPTVSAGDVALVKRTMLVQRARFSYCYEKELVSRPTLEGAITATFTIVSTGDTSGVSASGFDDTIAACVAQVITSMKFPAVEGSIQVRYPFSFKPGQSPMVPPAPASRAPEPDDESDAEPKMIAPLTGKLAEIVKLVGAKKLEPAMAQAMAWHADAPGDVLALIALGEVLEAKGEVPAAARIYGSIIDLFPSRADFRRFAGERLERLGGTSRVLAIDSYRRAVADRPDHATGHRLLAYALERTGDHEGALAAILAGVDQKYPPGRYAMADRVMREDAGMIAAVWIAAGGDRDAIVKQIEPHGVLLATKPSTRFIMYWETDANDVDFHIRDARGGHAWYQSRLLPSGGELYADITTGYGPECFAIDGPAAAAPYRLSINYYSQGPMGYGMGLLQVQEFDGAHFVFDDRPYVIMVDHAFVDLGVFRPSPPAKSPTQK